jgi:hypothetical protein
LHAEKFDHLVGLDLLRRKSRNRYVEIAADQRGQQQQHGCSGAHAQAQIGVPQRADHDHNHQQADEQGNQNREKARRQRQIMKLTEMHAALVWSGPNVNQCRVS